MVEPSSPSKPLGQALAAVALGAVGLWLFLRFNANGVQPGDAWIAYLPGAIAVTRLDLELLRESMAYGDGRPLLPPLLIAAVHTLLRGLSWPQAAHLLNVGAGLAATALSYRLLRRRLSPGWSVAGAVTVMASPPIVRQWVCTTPDMLFLTWALLLASAALADRPRLALFGFAAAVFTRTNGISMAPALLAFVLLRAARPMQRAQHAGAVVAITVLAQFVGRWAKPRASVFGSNADQWHSTIFIDGASGWSLGARLSWASPQQYWLFLRRAALGAPGDIFWHSWSEGRLESVPHLIFTIVTLAAAGYLVFRRLRSSGRRQVLLLIGLLLTLYLPLALFHWETRYFLPFFFSIWLAGFGQAALRAPRAAGWVAALLAGGLSLQTLHQLEGYFPTRSRLGLDDSEYLNKRAQVDAEAYLSELTQALSKRPILVQGCETMPLPFSNYLRFLHHPKSIRCSGWRFQRTLTADEIDAWIYSPQANYTTEPERTLRTRVRPVFESGGKTIGLVTKTSTAAAEEAPTPPPPTPTAP